MKRFLAAIALASVGSVAMAEQQPVMVILSDASPMTQGMAMVLANQMQAQGAQVDILLCDQGADLALKDAGGDALKPNDVTPAQLLSAAMSKGATASVCALYLPNTGHTPDKLKDGVAIAKPDAMARAMLEPSRKVFSF
ncbi:DsrE family protein [Pseudomonas sp. LM13]